MRSLSKSVKFYCFLEWNELLVLFLAHVHIISFLYSFLLKWMNVIYLFSLFLKFVCSRHPLVEITFVTWLCLQFEMQWMIFFFFRELRGGGGGAQWREICILSIVCACCDNYSKTVLLTEQLCSLEKYMALTIFVAHIQSYNGYGKTTTNRNEENINKKNGCKTI